MPAHPSRRSAAVALAAALALLLVGGAQSARVGAFRRSGYRRQSLDGVLRVLSIGDSITEGSVPSENTNHPYTIEMKRRLEEKLGRRVEVTNGGVGGAGIYAIGFKRPVTLVPHAKELMSKGKYDWVICLAGINDLLRAGRPAKDVMKGLLEIYKPALESGINVMAIAPLPAPGFVSQGDAKEVERLQLDQDIRRAGEWWSKKHPEGPLFAVTDLGVDGPMDFWKMGEQERARWLDDGLHLTKQAYDKMGDFIADALISQLSF